MLTENLQLTETDMTIFFRKLSEIKNNKPLKMELIKESFYKIEEVIDKTEDAWMYWFTQYLNRLQMESLDTDRKAAMNQVNPKYVLELHVAISH
jgi:uncharacterized protein YdiU (UPF0061 family)